MAFDLTSVMDAPANPALDQLGFQGQRSGALLEHVLNKSLINRRFKTRTLPNLASEEAASGRFFSGGAQTRAAQAAEDVQEQTARGELELQKFLGEIARNQFLTTIGLRV